MCEELRFDNKLYDDIRKNVASQWMMEGQKCVILRLSYEQWNYK